MPFYSTSSPGHRSKRISASPEPSGPWGKRKVKESGMQVTCRFDSAFKASDPCIPMATGNFPAFSLFKSHFESSVFSLTTIF